MKNSKVYNEKNEMNIKKKHTHELRRDYVDANTKVGRGE